MNRAEEDRLYRVAGIAMCCLSAVVTVVFVGLAVLAVLALAGCAAPLAAGPSNQRLVYAAESDFAAALRLAVAYEALPPCGIGVKLCAEHSVVVKVTASARAARASLSTAEAVVRARSNGAQAAALVSKAGEDVAAFKALAGALAQ